MARVYVSSTIADLEQERRAVIDWLLAAQHQPVHSYRPNSDTVRDSCLDDVDTCDLYVLILGHRYGFQPPDNNPEQLSITQLEFRRAGQCGIPRIALDGLRDIGDRIGGPAARSQRRSPHRVSSRVVGLQLNRMADIGNSHREVA